MGVVAMRCCGGHKVAKRWIWRGYEVLEDWCDSHWVAVGCCSSHKVAMGWEWWP